MKLTPKHKVLAGNASKAFVNRVKKLRIKKEMGNQTRKKQRKINRGSL